MVNEEVVTPLTWHDLVASVFAVGIHCFLVDNRVHDVVVGVPIQFAFVFRGEEGSINRHGIDLSAIRPRVTVVPG